MSLQKALLYSICSTAFAHVGFFAYSLLKTCLNYQNSCGIEIKQATRIKALRLTLGFQQHTMQFIHDYERYG